MLIRPDHPAGSDRRSGPDGARTELEISCIDSVGRHHYYTTLHAVSYTITNTNTHSTLIVSRIPQSPTDSVTPSCAVHDTPPFSPQFSTARHRRDTGNVTHPFRRLIIRVCRHMGLGSICNRKLAQYEESNRDGRRQIVSCVQPRRARPSLASPRSSGRPTSSSCPWSRSTW